MLAEHAQKLIRSIEIEAAIRRARLLQERLSLVLLIRDPVQRAISTIFNKLPDGALDKRCEAVGIDHLAEEMSATVRARMPKHLKRFVNWYRNTVPFALGVAALPSRGAVPYSIFETPTARCLFMATEHMDALAPALKEFTGSDIVPTPQGLSSRANRNGAELRQRLEASVTVGPYALATIYREPAMRAAYLPEELSAFQAKWRRGPLFDRLKADLRYIARQKP